ncbi:MAG: TolC family protein [candidate division Zixibacteria bacterium]|nr:TolC family protein [candidate division Zixibacteria bacterium]
MRKMVVFISLCVVGSAAEGAIKQLTLNDALSTALQKNFGYRKAEGNWEIAKADKTGAAGGLLPFVSASLSYGWTKRGPSSSFTQGLITIEGSDQTTTTANYNLGLDIRQSVFDGGATFSDYKAASAAEAASRETFRSERQKLIFNVKNSYFSALKARKLLEVQEDVGKRAEEQLKIAQARYDLGSASLSEVLKAKVEFANAQLSRISAQADYQVALAKLNSDIGENVNDSIELAEELGQPEAPALGFDEALLKAEKNHPDLLASQENLKAADWRVQAGRAGLYPSLSLSAGYGWNNRDFSRVASLFDRDYQWRFGFSIDYNIFDRFSTYRSLKSAQARHSNARQDYLQARSTVALEVKQAFLDLAKAKQKVEVTNQQVESAEEDLNIEQEKYNLGAATILDLLKAQENYKQAKTGQVEALFDYNMAIAGLKKSIGEE